MANEMRGVSGTGSTLYARVMNSAGLWGNGSSFEAFDAGSYTDYDNAMTEQGSSGVYVADFPSWITSSGTYEYYVHVQLGGTPAQGDPVVGTGRVDWSGTVAVNAATGSMSGSDFYAYVLRRGFKRTDKSAEVYEAITDAIQALRIRFSFDEAEVEAESTDTIATLGEYKLDNETDMGLLMGVIIEDNDTGTPLVQKSKAQFDALYPGINVDSIRGYPKHYCVFGGQILIGPAPDSVDYVYRLSYSRRAGTVTSSTSGVPFTDVYREMLAQFTLARLWADLDEEQKADKCTMRGEELFENATRRERLNSGLGTFNVEYRDC